MTSGTDRCLGGTVGATRRQEQTMTMVVERRGVVPETGAPNYHYASDGHVLLTGGIRGAVQCADGTTVDVSPDVIELDSQERAFEISHLIGLRHEDEGHPRHLPTPEDPHPEPFLHLCTPAHCGEHARPVTDPMQAMALARAQMHTNTIADAEVRAHFARALGTAHGDLQSFALASVTAENAALNGLDGTGSTNVIPDVSLHTATPGTTGASENANSGSYARLACSWNAAASGAKTNSSTLGFTTGGTVAVTHIGTWSSLTFGAGTYAIGAALGSSVTAASITVAAGGISFSAT